MTKQSRTAKQAQPDKQSQPGRKGKRARAEARQMAARSAARKARLQWVLIIGLGIAILGGVIGASVWDARTRSGDTSREAWDLPARDNDADGDGRIKLSDFAGKPTVVNFYADWCTVCEDEMPDFARVADDLDDQINFVHVNTQETGDWKRFMNLGTGHWPIARDINGQQGGGSGLYESVARPAGINGMPVTAFYDANGKWITTTGVRNESTLRATIAQSFGIGG